MVSRRRVLTCAFALAVGVAFALGCADRPAPPASLGRPDPVAPGVDFFRTADSALVADAGPIAVFLLRLDPARVRVTSALSNGEVLDAETVDGMARRLGAIAAVNGGYFNRDNGEPTGLLKVAGELVSDAGVQRGAVVFGTSPAGATQLAFDRLAARVAISFTADGHDWTLPIDGVDTTRARGKVMLYTPGYHADTDTAPNGIEWVLDGAPLKVVEVRVNAGHTAIPRTGVVLSFGGTTPPEGLAALAPEVRVTFKTTWRSAYGLPDGTLDAAEAIVNGAGLIRRDGASIDEWGPEGLSEEAFTGARHPRTLIGVDRRGAIWLATIDGRQPNYSIGMTFADLARLCDRLDLVSALNLDGGGSTTMVVRNQVVNKPSDPAGPRQVSDAIAVMPR